MGVDIFPATAGNDVINSIFYSKFEILDFLKSSF